MQTDIIRPQFVLRWQVEGTLGPGGWWFEFNAGDGSEPIKVADVEPAAKGERLLLLTLVRALEWLDQPSTIMLVCRQAELGSQLARGREDWRTSVDLRNPQLETSLANADLWRRLDRALRIHEVQYQIVRVDRAHRRPRAPRWKLRLRHAWSQIANQAQLPSRWWPALAGCA